MLITDKSIVTYGLKHGTSACRDLATALRNRQEKVREVSTDELLLYLRKEYITNPVPIFVNIRMPKLAIYSSYMQAIREVSKKYGFIYYNDSFLRQYYDRNQTKPRQYPFSLFNGSLNLKEQMVVVKHFLDNYLDDLYKLDDHIEGAIFYIQHAYKILNYIKYDQPELLQNLFIVNLDQYDTSEQSIGLLSDYKYMDQSLFESEKFKLHSTSPFTPVLSSYQRHQGKGGMGFALASYNSFSRLVEEHFSSYNYHYKRLKEWTPERQVEK